jgi:hypothetical protein
VSEHVPEQRRRDYREAAAVLELSPRASAALARRCLESVLEEEGGADQPGLSQKIEHVLPTLPAYIGADLHHFREVGNFGAHEQKDQHTGAILDVEDGEAEYALGVLDLLFDHYYVRPAEADKKRQAIDAKIDAAGRRRIS